MKPKDYLHQCEPLLLYLLLFFPALFVNNMAMASFFTSVATMLQYIIISIPQILLILYFFYMKKWGFKDNFTFSPILKTILLIILSTFVLFIISNLAALILMVTGVMPNGPKIESSKQFIPLYFLLSVITGYREELFFRAYLIKFFEKSASKTVLTIVISALFAICHISQGAKGVIISFISSAMLCFIFFRFKNIHINAISHALYNFFVLMASVFLT